MYSPVTRAPGRRPVWSASCGGRVPGLRSVASLGERGTRTMSQTTAPHYGLGRMYRTWGRFRPQRRAGTDGPGAADGRLRSRMGSLAPAVRSDLGPFPVSRRALLQGQRETPDPQAASGCSQTRVSRAMGAQGLLSPHCRRQSEAKTHDGRMATLVPEVVWGTDRASICPRRGLVWTLTAVAQWPSAGACGMHLRSNAAGSCHGRLARVLDSCTAPLRRSRAEETRRFDGGLAA